jgi:hypothetical protein
MVNVPGIARLGILAVGLGIGAAVAHSPVASADTSTDWLSSIDSLLTGGAVAAPSTSALNLAISFDGTPLVHDGNATATTVSGQFGLAIAYGDGAKAIAEGGTGNYALADGTDALAKAGSLTGTDSNYDSAIDIGNNVAPSTYPGAPDGAYAGGGSLIGGTDSGANSHDTAIDIGNNGTDSETLDGGNSGAFAGDGALVGGSGTGNGDTAYTYGSINGFGDGSAAVDGNNSYASTSGSETGTNEGAFVTDGNNNTAIADTSFTNDNTGVTAGYGNDNYAYILGPDNSNAFAGGGNSDIAYINDPFGSANAPDYATSGNLGSNDLAAVLFAHGDATTGPGNFIYDIVSLFGHETGTAAATSGSSFLTELLSLF